MTNVSAKGRWILGLAAVALFASYALAYFMICEWQQFHPRGTVIIAYGEYDGDASRVHYLLDSSTERFSMDANAEHTFHPIWYLFYPLERSEVYLRAGL